MTETKKASNTLLNRTIMIVIALAVVFAVFQLLPQMGSRPPADPSFAWGDTARNVTQLGVDSSGLREQQYRLQGNSAIPTYEFDHCLVESEYVGTEASPDNEFVLSAALAGFDADTNNIPESSLIYDTNIPVPVIINVDEETNSVIIARTFGIENLQLKITATCDTPERMSNVTQLILNGGIKLHEGQSVM